MPGEADRVVPNCRGASLPSTAPRTRPGRPARAERTCRRPGTRDRPKRARQRGTRDGSPIGLARRVVQRPSPGARSWSDPGPGTRATGALPWRQDDHRTLTVRPPRHAGCRCLAELLTASSRRFRDRAAGRRALSSRSTRPARCWPRKRPAVSRYGRTPVGWRGVSASRDRRWAPRRGAGLRRVCTRAAGRPRRGYDGGDGARLPRRWRPRRCAARARGRPRARCHHCRSRSR